jgi:hypothetical protein
MQSKDVASEVSPALDHVPLTVSDGRADFSTSRTQPADVSDEELHAGEPFEVAQAPAPAAASSVPAAAVAPAGSPAAIVPAGGDLEHDFESKSGDPDEYYFDKLGGGAFWLKNAAAEWVSLGEPGLRRHLKKDRGMRDKPVPGHLVSQCDEMISNVEKNRRVDYAGELAGYRSGFQIITGQRVLIPRSPALIVPKQGDWPKLAAYFEGLFCGEEPSYEDGKPATKVDQRAHFWAWHKQIMECYMTSNIASGLALCVAGEADSGKSRLAMILRWCLGDRVAKPYDFMIGRDDFNKDTYSAVLQLVDDENADTSIASRLKFGAQIKKLVANDEGKMRGMHRDGLNFEVLRRLVVLVNLESNRLMVMPPIDGDIRDKLLMLKGYRRPAPGYNIDLDTPAEAAAWPMPMPTRTDAEKATLRATWRAELPAYLWWLLNVFKVPSHVAGGRFSVQHWAHPQILERLQQFSPHVRIWQQIESAFVVFNDYYPGVQSVAEVQPPRWKPRAEWRGTARELFDLLKSDASKLTMDEKRGIPEPAWLRQRLEDVRTHFGAEVCDQKRTNKARLWILRQKPGLAD